jgi:hypothetical protein
MAIILADLDNSSMRLRGNGKALTVEEDPCKCSPFPYVLPVGYSNEDKRYWKLVEAWKDGSPLVYDPQINIFRKLQAKYPPTISNVGFIAIGSEFYMITAGDNSAFFLSNWVYISGGVNQGTWLLGESIVTEDAETDLEIVPPYPEGVHTFTPISPFGDPLEDLREFFQELPWVEDPDESVYGVSRVDNTPSYKLVGQVSFVDGCEDKPCYGAIQPVGNRCYDIKSPSEITLSNGCFFVEDDKITIDSNGIKLQNPCFEICDCPPVLKRARAEISIEQDSIC